MKPKQSTSIIFTLLIALFAVVAVPFATAQNNHSYNATSATVLDEETLDGVLAPIALYPDTLLTHMLIASTYPMDVIRAARWREQNNHLDAEQVRRKIEHFSWDPSVKALVPFTDVITQMSEDLDWLNYLGDSVIADEEWVMQRIQYLREQAYAQNSLRDNRYVNVQRDNNVIVIETVRDRHIYVPYYDTRQVYGVWWHGSSPYYWHQPRHYHYRAGFYWSPRIHIAANFFFGGFHWHHGYVVVNHNFHSGYRHHQYGHKRVYAREYKRWQHRVEHRGARYHTRVTEYHNVNRPKARVKEYGTYQQVKPLKFASASPKVVLRNTNKEKRLSKAVKSHKVSKSVSNPQYKMAPPKKVTAERKVTVERSKPYSNKIKREVKPKIKPHRHFNSRSSEERKSKVTRNSNSGKRATTRPKIKVN